MPAFAWTDELKEQVVKKYQEAEPTPENSMDIVSEIADEIGASKNGVRMILIKQEVYVKKTPAASTESSGGGSKRLSKTEAHEQLHAAITDKGLEPQADLIDKMTGKAAVYFAELINSI